MDQCVVDVTAIDAEEPVRRGDEVVMIGRQGSAEISAAEAGRRIGTINYDVVCRIMARVPRYVVSSQGDGEASCRIIEESSKAGA
jgi:alanine racemase